MSHVLGNRLVGILHGCLHRHSPYNEHTNLGTPHNNRRLTTYGPGMSTRRACRFSPSIGSDRRRDVRCFALSHRNRPPIGLTKR
jgi:hypothetical protein